MPTSIRFLQLIIVGQPQLRDLLLDPQLHQFAQRISSDFHLQPLSESEVANYIAFRLKAAGAKRIMFTLDAAAQDRRGQRWNAADDQHPLRYRPRLRICQ